MDDPQSIAAEIEIVVEVLASRARAAGLDALAYVLDIAVAEARKAKGERPIGSA